MSLSARKYWCIRMSLIPDMSFQGVSGSFCLSSSGMFLTASPMFSRFLVTAFRKVFGVSLYFFDGVFCVFEVEFRVSRHILPLR